MVEQRRSIPVSYTHLDVYKRQDFARVVAAVQNKGCRVEVVALDNASFVLRREVDLFMSGYLIPDLVPTVVNGGPMPDATEWGEVGSIVRGTCYFHKLNYGFCLLYTSRCV